MTIAIAIIMTALLTYVITVIYFRKKMTSLHHEFLDRKDETFDRAYMAGYENGIEEGRIREMRTRLKP